MGATGDCMDEAAEEAPLWERRAAFLQDYVLRTLRLKPERWQKCFSEEPHRELLRDFVERAEATTLVLALNPAGQLLPTARFPAGAKHKAVFFVKRGAEPLSADCPRSQLLCGDLSYAPLEHFSALVEEVVIPVLSNEKNHSSWPHVVSQDVMRHVNGLKSNIFVVIGQVQGKTLLPLPAGSERAEYINYENEKNGDTLDKAVVHAIESAIIEWSHQIRGVLKRESSEQLLQGNNPNPSVELEFWKNRQGMPKLYSVPAICSVMVSSMAQITFSSHQHTC